MTKVQSYQKGRAWSRRFENPVQRYDNISKEQIRLFRGEKQGSFLRHVPDDFCPAGTKGYALLRGFNCQARCHYCFLQSYFKSPDMVKFTNIDAYLPFLEKFIRAFKQNHGDEQRLVFFDGDFHDSLGYVWLTEDIAQINILTDCFAQYANVFLEIKTKCIMQLPKTASEVAQHKAFFDRWYRTLEIRPSLLTAITFSPQEIIDRYEPATAYLCTRLAFGQYVQSRGGMVGPRIDPIIIDTSLEESTRSYGRLVDQIQACLSVSSISDWWIGTLRVKDALYRQLKKHHSSMLSWLVREDGFWKYPEGWRRAIYQSLSAQIQHSSVSVCMEG